MAKVNVEKPSKRNIERLLKEMVGYNGVIDEICRSNAASEEADRAVAELEAAFWRSPKAVKAVALKEKLQVKRSKEREELKNMVAKVRRLYFAKGLTPMVLRKVEELVDFINGY